MFKLIFLVSILVGAVLFIIWAKDNLKKMQLLQLAIGLVALGLIGSLLINTVGCPMMQRWPNKKQEPTYRVQDTKIEELKKLMSTQ